MISTIEKAFDNEYFRNTGHQLIDMLADYLQKTTKGENGKVYTQIDPQEHLKKWEKDFSQEPNQEKLLDFFKEVISTNIHNHHPRYLGHQVAGALPVNALTDMIASLMNMDAGLYELGSPIVCFEEIIVKKMIELIGYPNQSQAGGIITSGGSLGNLTALLAARQIKTEGDTWENGLAGKKQIAFMVSGQSHYSVSRALKIMGLGEEGLVKVPVNERFEMKAECLEEYYQQALAEGKQVIGVIGNACSTSTGSYDPLDKIADFCEKYNLWFHVDGAHGGAVIFSDKLKKLVKGIERADSVVIDFHKMLMTSLLSTAVLFKSNQHTYQIFAQKAFYLWENQSEEEWHNLGKRTFECTKNAQGFRVYTILRTYGTQVFTEHVERLYGMGQTFANMIEESEDFELLMQPDTNIVCFRHCPKDMDETNGDEIQQQLRNAIIEEGEFYIVQTRIKGKLYLRVAIMNPLTTERELVQLMDKIRNVYQEMFANVIEIDNSDIHQRTLEIYKVKAS